MQRWHKVALVSLLASLLLVGAFVVVSPPPTARADATCGDTPDWWSPAYLTWEACEVSNGLMGALSQTEVINPLFQTISDTLNSINSWISDISGNVGSISTSVGNTFTRLGSVLTAVQAVPGQITDWFTPHDGDWQPLLDEINTVRTTYEPFATLDDITTLVTSIQSDWETAAGSFAPFASTTPSSLTAAVSSSSSSSTTTASRAQATATATSSGYDFGVLSSGVQMWLWFLDQCGISQTTIATVFDFFIVLTTALSALKEFGINTGEMIGGLVGRSDVGGMAPSPLSRLDSFRVRGSVGRDAKYLRRRGL